MARGVINHLWRNGFVYGVVPFGLNLVDVAPHANTVNLAIGSKSTNQDWNIILTAFAIGDIRE